MQQWRCALVTCSALFPSSWSSLRNPVAISLVRDDQKRHMFGVRYQKLDMRPLRFRDFDIDHAFGAVLTTRPFDLSILRRK